MGRKFEQVTTEHIKNTAVETLLPLRGTKTSAGYDFYTPVDLVIRPQEKVLFWTDVKAEMGEGEVLLLDVRSSMGVKQDLMIANTIGVIDADYHNNPSNDGNIGICLRNLKPSMRLANTVFGKFNMYVSKQIELPDGQIDNILVSDYKEVKDAKLVEVDMPLPIIQNLYEANTVFIKAGERVAQGFFVNYLASENCNSEAERKGGIGSTNEESK